MDNAIDGRRSEYIEVGRTSDRRRTVLVSSQGRIVLLKVERTTLYIETDGHHLQENGDRQSLINISGRHTRTRK